MSKPVVNIAAIAADNLGKLRANSYPGRGLIIGLNETGTAMIQVYWIMGRSSGSRNRVLKNQGGGKVSTDLADTSQSVGNPDLTIYPAMEEAFGIYAISNGRQTSTIVVVPNLTHTNLDMALTGFKYEPDEPNFTPRISGFCRADTREIEISILRRALIGDGCDRALYRYEKVPAGFGYHVSTYAGDGNPLPSFKGDPLLMPLTGSLEKIAQDYWDILNPEHRVALVAKSIPCEGGLSQTTIINQYTGVSTSMVA